ncbi:uncharacterized protein [Choristoneura fumiferana]|uniref:uncharacterized protein n=1 Tax=Choristoneura fumiferana TaxID=7141 RepID=UPI003D15DF3C
MAAACKTSKPDLVAIYRLEFYKKQKNWKFCTTERKKEEERKKAAKNAKAKLNQTYSIEPAPERDKDTSKKETEDVNLAEEAEKVRLEEAQKQDAETAPAEEKIDDLNEAFVDTETDDNTTPIMDPPTGPYSPKWSVQQWAARCRAWNCEPAGPDPQFVPSAPAQHPVWSDPTPYMTSDHTQPYHVQEDAILGQALTDYEADLFFKRKNMPCPDANVPHGAMLDTGNTRAWEPRGGCWGEGGWPRYSQVWTNQHEEWFEEICDIPEEAIEAIEALEVAQVEAAAAAGAGAGAGAGADAVDCARAHCLLAEPEPELEPRAADWRGSAASLDKGAMYRSDSLPSVSSGSFARGAALAAHSTQLDLGAGAGVSPAPAELYSFDEYPTRDVGPATCDAPPPPPPPPHSLAPSSSSVFTHNPTVVNDVFVAGRDVS